METAASQFVVALDVGSSRTRCLIAQLAGDDVQIVGRGEETSRGVRRGEVVDLPAARYTVHRAVAEAESTAGLEIQTLFLTAGSRHVRFVNNRACIGITREERTVTGKDVRNVLASARRVTLPDDAMPIGTPACSFAVDDVRQVREPEGMRGTRLEAEVHVITDARTITENLAACLDPDEREVEEYVFAAFAAGEAVLEDDEKTLGAAVIDLGAGTTRLMVYRDGAPVFSSVVPLGGDHITSDIAVGMDLALADAARLKEDHASVAPRRAERPVTFKRLGKSALYSVDPRRLHAIVDCRVREILDIVRRELMRAAVRPASLRAVLTGGASRLPGIDTLAATRLGCPTRLGRPRALAPASDGMGPEMSAALGLLALGQAARRRQAAPADFGNPARRLLDWVKQRF